MELGESKKYNLEIFAKEYYGFVEDKRSTRNAPKLRNGADIAVIKRQSDGNYTFWSPDDRKGSIIDFVMWREGCDAKSAVHKINEFLQGHIEAVKSGKASPPPDLETQKPFDRSKIDAMKPVADHAYLASRGITLLNHGRFRGTICTDARNNAVFPHLNAAGNVVGYTMKNDGFTCFSPGGVKTVWESNQFANDNRLVVCEASIDALSYAELLFRRDPEAFFHTRYISTDGGIGLDTEDAICYHLKTMPPDALMVAAFDHDAQGWKYVEHLYRLCEEVGREMKVDLPKVDGYDWNNVLRKFLEREVEKNASVANQEVTQCAM